MIIAFYPGAGGNRLLQKILNKDWAQPNRIYDNENIEQIYRHRYLLDSLPDTKSQYILTHCMNSEKIQQMLPNRQIVFIRSDLKQSLQREWALCGHNRYCEKTQTSHSSRLDHYLAVKDPSWPMIAHDSELENLPEHIQQEVNLDYAKIYLPDQPTGVLEKATKITVAKTNSAYEIITWHLDYYQKYPVDLSGAHEIVDIDNDQSDFATVMQRELSRYNSDIFTEVWNAIEKQ